MNKQELYEELQKKYRVPPIDKWQSRNSSEATKDLYGISTYIIPLYSRETGQIAPTVTVEDEGKRTEFVKFSPREDPLKEKIVDPKQQAVNEYNVMRNALVNAKADVELGIIDQEEYDTMLIEIKKKRQEIEGM